MVHFSGTQPQLSLQIISGVGIPIAVQLIVIVYVGSTSIFGGGLTTIVGEAIQNVNIQCAY